MMLLHKNALSKLLIFFFTIVLSGSPVLANSPKVKIDFDHNTSNMSQVRTDGYTSIVGSGTLIDTTISGVTFRFENTGVGSGLSTNWYKNGILLGETLINDVLKVDVANDTEGAEITMTISGLSTGTHTLLFYFNNIDGTSNTFSPIDLTINNTLMEDDFLPPNRCATKYDAHIGYFNVDAIAGNDVVVVIAADPAGSETNKNIGLCGFELNTPNSLVQSSNAIPNDADEHVDGDNGSVTLQWDAAKNAASHLVYFGTDPQSVVEADLTSPEFKGEQSDTFWVANTIYSMNTYYWRVDEKDSAGTVTTGSLWMFRPRQQAFDGAEGYGRYARGGRGGKVVYVTTLDDYNPETEAVIPGSLREAVTADIGPRTVVFAVSGIIELKTRLTLNRSYVTVAGQTAPGKGITIKSAPFGMSGVNDVIIRNMRVRLGYGQTYDGMGMQGSSHCIIDHSSISWTIDESFSSRSARNISLQRTLISEALNDADHENYPSGTKHGYAASISGDIGSFHHNLLAHCYGRNWSMAGGLDADNNFAGRLDIFNNVVYNWGTRATDGGAHEVNFVGNYYKPGAATSMFYALTANHEDDFGGSQRYYFNGNKMPGYFDESNQEDGRRSIIDVPISYEDFVNTPFFTSDATIQTADQAYKDVLSDVGCTQPVFDEHDIRIIEETLNGTYTYSGSETGLPGLPDRESDVGGYESYPEITREADFDTDLDGLPNWWEKVFGLDTNSVIGDFSEANADDNQDGFTNLDNYLEWMAKPHSIVNAGEEVKVSLVDLFKGYTNTPVYSASKNSNCEIIISHDTAYISSVSCGLASVKFSVTDTDGDGMTKDFELYFHSDDPGNCDLSTPLTIQENADGFCSYGGTIDTNHDNYTGDGFTNVTNDIGQGIDYEVVVGEAGDYILNIRYSATSDRPANFIVDGSTVATNKSFPATADWDTWATVSDTVTLAAGTHDIRIESTTAEGLSNIDYLQVSGADVVEGDCSGNVPTYTLTVTSSSNGSVSDVNGTYNYGTEVEVIATPAVGYQFDGWSGDAGGTQNPLTISMDSDKDITAGFSLIPVTYTLTANAGSNGTVTDVNGVYDDGEEVTITATPNTGYEFSGWTGDVISSDNPVTVTMNADVEITASFSIKSYSLTVSSIGSGAVTDVNGEYNYGTDVEISATPAAGYQFDGWSGDATGTDNPLIISMDSETNITANFSLIPVTYTLTANAGSNGTVTDVSGVYNDGEEVTITATPDADYEFAGWTGDLTSIENPVVVAINADISITANFAIKTYELTVFAGVGGTVSDVNGNYDIGSQVEITATPAEGYVFSGWTGDLTSTENPITITLESPISMEATFTEDATNTMRSNEFTDKGIKMYPNPTTTMLQLDLGQNDAKYTQLEIYSTSGERIIIQSISSENATIDVSELSPGIYLIYLKGADRARSTFIKK